MAVGNISGPLLTANLLRNGKDLAFETDLLFLNVSDPNPQNFKVGIGTSSPAYLLDISGITRSTNIKSTEVDVGNVNIKENTIKSSVNNLTIQSASTNDKIILASNVESSQVISLSGEVNFNTTTNNQTYTTTGAGVITIESGTVGSINNIKIGDTTPSTGNFTLLTIGTEATPTRFPNTKLIISDTVSGIQQNEDYIIGLLSESTAGTTNNHGVGIYGVGYTSADAEARGVVGEAHVSLTSNSHLAIGVLGYSTDTHAGGNNIALYARAANSANDYALFMEDGNIKNQTAQTWELGGNLTFTGSYSVTIPTLALDNPLPVTSGGTGVTTSTGTGNVVLSDSPSLVSPILGNATATTLNKLTITNITNSAILNIADSSSLITSGSNSLTLTTTADTNVTFPTTGLLINSNETTLASLSSVGTITTGTWSGLFGAVTGANLTNLTAANLTGTIPDGVLGTSSIYIGSTEVALNRKTGSLTLVDVHFGTTDVSASFTIPVGTTSQRPTTPSTGNIRYNNDTNNYEGYNGANWNKIGAGLTPTPVKTSDYHSTEAQLVRCDTKLGSFSVYLPESPVDGCLIGIIDVANYFAWYPVSIIPPTGTTVELDPTSAILDVNGAYISLVYTADTNNWKIQETPNMLSNFQLSMASTTNAGAVKVDGNTIIINAQGVISAVGAVDTNGSLTSIIATNPMVSSGGTTPIISIIKSSSTTNGYLSSTDWNTFNNKLGSVPKASPFTLGGIKVGAGLEIDTDGTLRSTGAVIVPVASPSTVGGIRVGYGLSIDENAILNTDNFVTTITGILPIVSSGSNDIELRINQAAANSSGYLSAIDWNIFNNKLGEVPMASANVLGGVKIGSGLSIDGFGILSATTAYTLPISSDVTLGGVKVDGSTITIDSSGTISSYGKITLQVFTSNLTPQVLTINADLPSASNQLLLNTDQAVMFTGLIVAKQQGSSNVATYTVSCTAVNNGGTLTLVASNVTNVTNTINLTVQPSISIDYANSAISITSGSKATTNIKWTAILDIGTATYA